MKKIYLDTETTGFGSKNRIVQLAFLLEDNDKLEKYDVIVNPHVKINKNASEVHKIYDEDVFGKPNIQDTEAWKVLNRYNDRQSIMFIHNASFDLPMLGYDGFKPHCIIVDTLRVAKILLNEQSNSLQELRRKSKVIQNEQSIMKAIDEEEIKAHNALGDVITLKAFVDYLVDRFGMDKVMKAGRLK